MNQGVVSILLSSKNRIVMQRRDSLAPNNPNLLTFFGGHLYDSEKPLDGLLRELKEETSLKIESLSPKFLFTKTVSNKSGIFKLHVFEIRIPDANFTVYEGSGAESYKINELLKRNDIASADFGILKEYARLE